MRSTSIEPSSSTEGARDLNPAADRQWLVESTTKHNALGEATGYELKVPGATTPFSDPSYAPLQRAPFAQHPVWVTAYHDGELYAGGDYPNQGAPGQGLNCTPIQRTRRPVTSSCGQLSR